MMPPEILEKFIKFCERPEVFQQLISDEQNIVDEQKSEDNSNIHIKKAVNQHL